MFCVTFFNVRTNLEVLDVLEFGVLNVTTRE